MPPWHVEIVARAASRMAHPRAKGGAEARREPAIVRRQVMTSLDTDLWDRFHAATLPVTEWLHEAHLRVAWMYLRGHSLDDAHILMRVGIIRLNASHGLVETPARGYHETMTRVWLRLVAAAMRSAPEHAASRPFLEAHAASLAKDAPLRHYTRERLFSATARARFVEPDVLELP